MGTLSGVVVFGPSRFVGAQANARQKHAFDPGDGGRANYKIDAILGNLIRYGHSDWVGLEDSYLAFCDSVDVKPRNYREGNERKFWNIDQELDLDPTTFIEGRRILAFGTRSERSLEARQECIKHHGLSCVVCGFDFKKRYGKLGCGFIHVHHIDPLASGEREVDSKKYLRPVCPNCHCMLHRGEELLTPKQLRKKLRQRNAS